MHTRCLISYEIEIHVLKVPCVPDNKTNYLYILLTSLCFIRTLKWKNTVNRHYTATYYSNVSTTLYRPWSRLVLFPMLVPNVSFQTREFPALLVLEQQNAPRGATRYTQSRTKSGKFGTQFGPNGNQTRDLLVQRSQCNPLGHEVVKIG